MIVDRCLLIENQRHSVVRVSINNQKSSINNRFGGKLRKARDLQVWTTLSRLDGAHASPRRRAVNPNGGQTECLRREHVVVKALAHVQDTVGRNADAAQGEVVNL